VHELPTSLVLVASYVSVTAVALVTRVTNEPEGRHLAYATCVHATQPGHQRRIGGQCA
jgi:hypothetical protein